MDGQVTVDEVLAMVNIALGSANIATCPAGDANHDNQITIDEIIAAVQCPERLRLTCTIHQKRCKVCAFCAQVCRLRAERFP